MCLCFCCRTWRRESSILIHSCDMETVYLSGRCSTDWDHKDTHKLSEWPLSPVLYPKTHSKAPSFNLENEDVDGLPMVLLSQEPGQIQNHSTQPNPLKVWESHTPQTPPTVMYNPGATWVLSWSLPMLLLGTLLILDNLQNQQIGWCQITASPLLSITGSSYAPTNMLSQDYACKSTNTH